MDIAKLILSAIKAMVTVLGWFLGVLVSAVNPETNFRPQEYGSDRFGEYNFRTGRFDSGTDPNGWYEEDM